MGIDGLKDAVRRIKKIEREDATKRIDKIQRKDIKEKQSEIKEVENEFKEIKKAYEDRIRSIKQAMPRKRTTRTPGYIKKLDKKLDRIIDENAKLKSENKRLKEAIEEIKKPRLKLKKIEDLEGD